MQTHHLRLKLLIARCISSVTPHVAAAPVEPQLSVAAPPQSEQQMHEPRAAANTGRRRVRPRWSSVAEVASSHPPPATEPKDHAMLCDTSSTFAVSERVTQAFFRDVEVNNTFIEMLESIAFLGEPAVAPSDWLRLKALCFHKVPDMNARSIAVTLRLLTAHGVCGPVEVMRLQEALAAQGSLSQLPITQLIGALRSICTVDGATLSPVLAPLVFEVLPRLVADCVVTDLPSLVYAAVCLGLFDDPQRLLGESKPASETAVALLLRIGCVSDSQVTQSQRVMLLWGSVAVAPTLLRDEGERTSQEAVNNALCTLFERIAFGVHYTGDRLTELRVAPRAGLFPTHACEPRQPEKAQLAALAPSEVSQQLKAMTPRNLLLLHSALHDFLTLSTHGRGAVTIVRHGTDGGGSTPGTHPNAAMALTSHGHGATAPVDPLAQPVHLEPSGLLKDTVDPALTAGPADITARGTTSAQEGKRQTQLLELVVSAIDLTCHHLVDIVLRCELQDRPVMLRLLEKMTESGAPLLSKSAQQLSHLLIRAVLFSYSDAALPGPWLQSRSSQVYARHTDTLCDDFHAGQQSSINREAQPLYIVPPLVRSRMAVLGFGSLAAVLEARLDVTQMLDPRSRDALTRPGIFSPMEIIVVAEALDALPLSESHHRVYATIVTSKVPRTLSQMANSHADVSRLLRAVGSLGELSNAVRAATREVLRSISKSTQVTAAWEAILVANDTSLHPAASSLLVRGGTDAAHPRSPPGTPSGSNATVSEAVVRCCMAAIDDGSSAHVSLFRQIEDLAQRSGMEAPSGPECLMVLRCLSCRFVPVWQHQGASAAVTVLFQRAAMHAIAQVESGGTLARAVEVLSYGAHLGVPHSKLISPITSVSELLLSGCLTAKCGHQHPLIYADVADCVAGYATVLYHLQLPPEYMHPRFWAALRSRLAEAAGPHQPGVPLPLSSLMAMIYLGDDQPTTINSVMAALAAVTCPDQGRGGAVSGDWHEGDPSVWLPMASPAVDLVRLTLVALRTPPPLREELAAQLLGPLSDACREAVCQKEAEANQPSSPHCRYTTALRGDALAAIGLAAAAGTVLVVLTHPDVMQPAKTPVNTARLVQQSATLRAHFGELVSRVFSEDGTGGGSGWSLSTITRTLTDDAMDGQQMFPGVTRQVLAMLIAQGIQVAARHDDVLKKHAPLGVALWKQCLKRTDRKGHQAESTPLVESSQLLTAAVALHFAASNQATDAILDRFQSASAGSQAGTTTATPQAAPYGRANALLSSFIAESVWRSGRRRPAVTRFIADVVQRGSLRTLPAHALLAFVRFLSRDAERVALGQAQVDSLSVRLWTNLEMKLPQLSASQLTELLPTVPTTSRVHMLLALKNRLPEMTASEMQLSVPIVASWDDGMADTDRVAKSLEALLAAVRQRVASGVWEDDERTALGALEAFVGDLHAS